ncbi:MAG: hypothetical protein FWC00_02390 [Firmicutes bacterium]|nr:hypothetical protein [Bacillota bacterium]
MKNSGKTGIPYVAECNLFAREGFKHAEELLAEYNDFYLYNMAELATIHYKIDEAQQDEAPAELDEEKRIAIADKNAKAATDHFASLFGSKDFPEATIAGLKPAWYDLQKILLNEYKQKTPIYDSAMNGIAPGLRKIASVMLFALYVTEGMDDLNAEDEEIEAVKEGFRTLFGRIQNEKIDIPEYHKEKVKFKKFKKPTQYIEFAEKLFSLKGE